MSDTLPVNLDAERFVLGSILLDDSLFVQVAGSLQAEDFALDKHRRIFLRMAGLHERNEKIDRVTVFNELLRFNEAETCDGLSYLVSLDDGLPRISNVDSYARIVRDKSTLRRIIASAEQLMRDAMAHGVEPSELLAKAGTSFLSLAGRGAESTLQTPQQIIEAAGGFQSYVDRRNHACGTPTGYSALDVMLGGFKPGGLYILAARPSMGKTALALNIAERVAVDREFLVPVFSLEMDKESLLDRLLCSRARVNTRRFDGGYLSEDERKRIAHAVSDIASQGNRILIDDKANTNTQEIHSKIRKQQARGPVGLVILDYLQLLIDGDDAHRVAAASRISREMKLIAKDCHVPVLALAQLSRSCEMRNDKRPILSDLRETGAIEQDADVVAMLFREEVYVENREDLRGRAELIIRKQRGGPTGTIEMYWRSEIVRFEEMASS